MKAIIFIVLFINICLAKVSLRLTAFGAHVASKAYFQRDDNNVSWEPNFDFEGDEELNASFPIYLRFRGIEHVFYRKDWNIRTIFMKLAGENSYLDCLRDSVGKEYKRDKASLMNLYVNAKKSENHVNLMFCPLANKAPFIF